MECASIRALCACRVHYFDFISISLNAYTIHLCSLKKISKNSRNFRNFPGISENFDFVAYGASARYFIIASCSDITLIFEKIIARI